MKWLERLLYLALISGFAMALSVVILNKRSMGADAIFRRVEIQDSSGHTRIVLATDSDGTAQIRLTDASGKKNSVLKQCRDGTTTLGFAGPGQWDSISMTAPQVGPGPSIGLVGNTDDQMMYLGPGDLQDDLPPVSPKAGGWGLYVPAGNFKPSPSYAAIGAYRDQKTGKIRGFVHTQH